MNFVNVSDLRVKIFTSFRSCDNNKKAKGRVRVRGITENQIFLESPVSLEEIESLSQVSVYLCVNEEWKTYNIINIYPDPNPNPNPDSEEEKEEGKVRELSFHLGEREQCEFNLDLLSILCRA